MVIKKGATMAQAGKEEVVRYVGSADTRRLSAGDFTSLGAKDQKKATWDGGNSRALPASDFTEEALAALSKLPDFTITKG